MRRTAPQGSLVSLVIPVFNNALQLPQLTDEIEATLRSWKREVIFIDDGSTDSSWQLITELAGRRSGSVCGLKLSGNFGQHYAILAGLRQARGDYVVVLDADLQDDPAFIPKMIATAQNGYDVVHARRQSNTPPWGRFLRWIVHKLLTVDSEVPLHDAMGNYKLLSRRALKAALAFAQPYPLFELMVKKSGFRAGHVDVQRRVRTIGRSSYDFKNSVRFIRSILKHFSMLTYDSAIAVGGCLALLTGLSGWINRHQMSVTNLILLAIAFQSGLILLLAGFLGRQIANIRKTAADWPEYIIADQVNTRSSP